MLIIKFYISSGTVNFQRLGEWSDPIRGNMQMLYIFWNRFMVRIRWLHQWSDPIRRNVQV